MSGSPSAVSLLRPVDLRTPSLRQAFTLRQSIYPKGGLRVAQAADSLADCLISRNEYAAAKPFAKIAYDEFAATYGDMNRLTMAARRRLENVDAR